MATAVSASVQGISPVFDHSRLEKKMLVILRSPETSYPPLYTGRKGGRLFILASVSFIFMNIYKDSK